MWCLAVLPMAVVATCVCDGLRYGAHTPKRSKRFLYAVDGGSRYVSNRRYKYVRNNISFTEPVDADDVLVWFVQAAPKDWKRLEYRHKENRYSINELPVFARASNGKWYKFEDTSYCLREHVSKLPLYRGPDQLLLNASDFARNFDSRRFGIPEGPDFWPTERSIHNDPYEISRTSQPDEPEETDDYTS